jgi:hypothetical protein
MLLWGTLVGDWETKHSAMLTVVRDDLLQERDDRRRAVLVWLGDHKSTRFVVRVRVRVRALWRDGPERSRGSLDFSVSLRLGYWNPEAHTLALCAGAVGAGDGGGGFFW